LSVQAFKVAAVVRQNGLPRAAPCARPRVLVKGQPGIFLELTVDFLAHQRHLPLVKLTRAA
jgi:hypothetical protein